MENDQIWKEVNATH